MGRVVILLLALVGAGFVGYAGAQAASWLAPSIEAVDAARGGSAQQDPLREQDETHEVVDDDDVNNDDS